MTPAFHRAVAATLLITLLAACGGDGAVTTTTTAATTSTTVVVTTSTLAAVTTTTLPPATTTTTEAGFGIDDIPQACYDVIVEVLHLYEPAVSGVDWENATIDDHFQLMIDLGGASIDSTEGCDDVEGGDMSDAAGQALLIEIAELEAPGAVGYLQAMLEINQALAGRGASGDCLTDIAAMDLIVADGVKWLDLPLAEQVLVLGLMSSIGYCSLQTQGAFISRPEVQEFFEGSPFG